ncbi:solute carrier family 2, facilitated glucose transporter member 1-like [Lineus longissimus]|uniref:solute carrier family 2, facilitated glucose transporter member 1-like n=1 Tax=Lineus longissimus TaxID=88925 RepID=UPI002B4F7BCC
MDGQMEPTAEVGRREEDDEEEQSPWKTNGPSVNEDYRSLSLSTTLPSLEETVHGMTRPLMFSCVACCLGTSFQSGYNLGVLNAPQKIIEDFLGDVHFSRTGQPLAADLLTWLFAIIVSIFCIGAIFGGLAAGPLANHFGRKGAMLLNNLFTIVAGLMFCLSKTAMSYEMLVVGRFVAGFSAGISTAIGPLYVSEVAPMSIRGAVGCLSQFTIILGILTSMILGLPSILGTADLWPALLGFSMAPAFLQLILMPFCPETPRFLLITKEDSEGAKRALTTLRSTKNVSRDIEEMIAETALYNRMTKVSIGGLFKYKDLRQQTIVSVMLQLSQQFSGIGAIAFYSTSFFQSAHLSPEQASYGTISVFIVNAIMTFVAMMVMDRMGRRTLQLYGLAGMWAASMLITISFLFKEQWPEFSYLLIVFTIIYVMVYAIGPGPIPWFMVAEFFPQGSRGAAVSLAVICNWLSAFIIGMIFPWMQGGLGDYVFLPFAALLAAFWLFTYLKVPETRRRTIVEITSMFQGGDIRGSGLVVNREGYQECVNYDSTSYRALVD